MKRMLLILFVLFVVVQFITIKKVDESVDKNLEIKVDDKVMSILKRACYDCHSNEIKYPWYSTVAPFSWVIDDHIKEGRKALNFSLWENYTLEQKSEHLKDIYRTVYAPMPLQSYLWLHKEAELSKEERSLIRDWTGVRSK
jgi:hypothetical protein